MRQERFTKRRVLGASAKQHFLFSTLEIKKKREKSVFFFFLFLICVIIKDIDMLLDDLDLRIWVSFFTADILYFIWGYIAKWLEKPVEEAYQFWYKIKMKREKS